MVSKFCPKVFDTFPEFRKFDPTLSLPPSVREKAVRLFSRNLQPTEPDDVQGVVSSLYAERDLKGSMITVAFDTPIAHALRVYDYLSHLRKTARVAYDSTQQKVHVNVVIGSKNYGFWFDCALSQIQTLDLQHALRGESYLGIAFPITLNAYEEFISDTVGGKTSQLPDNFYESQIVNDWLIFHLSHEKVIRQSVELQGNSLRPVGSLPGQTRLSTKQWLTASIC